MRVAQLIDNLKWGGAQKMMAQLAQALAERQHEITVISLGSSNTPLAEDLRAHHIRVVEFSAPHLFDPVRLGHLAHFLRSEKFDILHSYLTYANIMGVLAGKLTGVPVVASLHSAGIDPRFYHPIRYQIETWLLRFGAHCVIANGCSIAKANQQRLGHKRIVVIPNAVTIPPSISTAERVALRAELLPKPNRLLLISVGRLSPPKGYSDLLTAFAKVLPTHRSVFLMIVGDGSLRSELERQVESLVLNQDVLMTGARSDIPRLLAASDLFVNASHWEGLSVAILEAMAAGLPVVATSVGDTPRIVIPGTGLVVPPQQPAHLAEALCKLLDQPQMLPILGEAARNHITNHYNLATSVEQFLPLYAGIIQQDPVLPKEIPLY
mgnify:CR=1 FL=1